MIYQYYLADRDDKKQDFTPASLALLLGELLDDSNDIIDMCAGSGALIIQSWTKSPDKHFTAYEVDENVLPFLLFNLTVRNIDSDVFLSDVLGECEYKRCYKIRKGERFGQISDIKSAI